MERRTRIVDVAELAGVSIGTASKALSGDGRMRAETRQRVVEAARRLNYHPNRLSQSLLTGRTFTVGMIVSDLSGRFGIPLLQGAEGALSAGEVSVFLCDTREDPLREQHYVQSLVGRNVDGILVASGRTDPRPPIRIDVGIPTVYMMAQSTDLTDTSIVSDERHGVSLAFDHLMTGGRRRIAHIGGPEHERSVQIRSAALNQRLGEEGLQLTGGGSRYGNWTEDWGRRACAQILRSGEQFDAVFCDNDQIARGVLETLQRSGRRVPEDVAVVGWDNWDFVVEACRPRLSSVDMNIHAIGRTAASYLLAEIKGEKTPGVIETPCSFIVRESTVPELHTAELD